ncbi:hypothetical protein THAOC_32584, partial [Thalassiosira oceanica]
VPVVPPRGTGDPALGRAGGGGVRALRRPRRVRRAGEAGEGRAGDGNGGTPERGVGDGTVRPGPGGRVRRPRGVRRRGIREGRGHVPRPDAHPGRGRRGEELPPGCLPERDAGARHRRRDLREPQRRRDDGDTAPGLEGGIPRPRGVGGDAPASPSFVDFIMTCIEDVPEDRDGGTAAASQTTDDDTATIGTLGTGGMSQESDLFSRGGRGRRAGADGVPTGPGRRQQRPGEY